MENRPSIAQDEGRTRRESDRSAGCSRERMREDQNFKRRRFSDTQPVAPSSVRTQYIQPPGCKSPSKMVSEIPGRMVGPGLLLDESANNGMFPPGAVSFTVTVTFCPSLNIGSREGVTGAAGLAAAWGSGTTAGAVGGTAAAGEVSGVKGAEVPLLGPGAACGAGTTGAGSDGFGFMAIGGGVLSSR